MIRKIITDSGCDCKSIQGVDYVRVPFNIDVDKTYIDEINIDVEMLVNKIETTQKTNTACPSPHSWYEAAKGADEVFMLPLTREMSGSYNSALVAKDMLEDDGTKVMLIDTLSASSGITIMVEKIAEMIKDKKTFQQIKDYINTYRVKLNFVLYSIDNLVKTGRAPKIAGIAVNTLGISVIGEDRDGEFSKIGKTKGTKKMISSLMDRMKLNGYSGGKVVISHCLNIETAEKLKEKLTEIFKNADIKIMPTSGLCSYYCERKGFLIGYEV